MRRRRLNSITVESLERKSEEENDDDDDDNNSCGDKRGVLSVNAENEEKKEKKTKKIKKSVNFSLNHLEDVAGVADDIDREAWELPRTCDGCGLYILGERWSCGKCVEETEEEFDFCKACFVAFMEVERVKVVVILVLVVRVIIPIIMIRGVLSMAAVPFN